MAQNPGQKKGPKKKVTQSQAARKWKGKDWFDIVSPAEFGGNIIYQTPSTDPESLIGRNVNVPVSQLTGERNKYYMWLRLKVTGVKGTNASTAVNGFQCMSEYLSRAVRKRKDKIEITHITKTKDGWKIRVKPLVILTNNVSSAVKTSARLGINGFIDENANRLTMTELTKEIISGSFQMKMKKTLSKTYPVRFAEVSRIKVLESRPDMPLPNEEMREKVEAAGE